MARQSAIHHWAEQAGALHTTHHGFATPARYSDARQVMAKVLQSSGLADVSWIAKFDLKGRGVDAIPALKYARSWTLGPRHLLVTCAPEHRDVTAAQCTAAPAVFVTDVTSVFAQFLLVGLNARDIMAKLSSLNVSARALPDGGCAQTSLAHVHATILRRDLKALPAFHLLIQRDYAEFAWVALLHAGHEFQLAPFGLEALRVLGD